MMCLKECAKECVLSTPLTNKIQIRTIFFLPIGVPYNNSYTNNKVDVLMELTQHSSFIFLSHKSQHSCKKIVYIMNTIYDK